MAVPIGYLKYFNPGEYDIISANRNITVNGKNKFTRLVIKRKTQQS